MGTIHPSLEPLAFDIARLSPMPGNPRKGDVDAVVRSYSAFGQRKPIVARREGEGGIVIAGNHQLAAAKKMGWERIAVVFVEDDDITAKAFALADNRTSDLGTYDSEALADLIRDVSISEELLASASYSLDDLDKLLGVEALEQASGDLDRVPDSAPAKTVPGDVWLLGPHRVMCGDSTSPSDLAKLMAGGLADMVWTDPPYNVDYQGSAGGIKNDALSSGEFRELLDGAFASAFQALRPGGAIYVAHSEAEGTSFADAFVAAGFKLAGTLIWRKNALVLGRSDYQWQHEPILYGWKPGKAHKWYGGRRQTTIIEATDSPFVQLPDGRFKVAVGDRVYVVSGDALAVEQLDASVLEYDKPKRSSLHPTMKPVALVARQVANSSRKRGVVLDLFGGSGTTLVAAWRTERVARLMELDPKFVDVICRRYQELTGELPVAEASGNSHDFSDGDEG